MKELSDIAIIVLGTSGVIAFLYVVIAEIFRAGSVYEVWYNNLMSFKYYVDNCEVNTISRDIIKQRLKIERGKAKGTGPEYMALVYDITEVYIKRFAGLIAGERESNQK